MIPRIYNGTRRTRGGGGGGDWYPTEVSSLFGWHDSTSSDNFTFSTGTSITQWDDLSGNGNHFAAYGGSSSELQSTTQLNSIDTVQCDKGEGFQYDSSTMTLTLNNTRYKGTVALVIKIPTGVSGYNALGGVSSANYCLVGHGSTTSKSQLKSNNSYYPLVDANGDVARLDGTPLYDFVAGSDYNDCGWNDAYNYVYSNSDWQIIVCTFWDTTDASSGDWDRWLHTGNNTVTLQTGCYVAEICLFDEQLSSSDVEKMEGYLAHRWGLEGNLPAGHTYKSSPPTA